MGSFGTVWAAEQKDGSQELALKEVTCRCRADLQNALFEAHLLRTLGGGPDRPRKSTPSRLPALIASEILTGGADATRVCLAMTRMPGEPVDLFLQDWRRKTVAGRRCTAAQSVHFARELLVQLCPTFEEISAVAYHRDVNAHNILIEGGWSATPSFGLVDFGLAVDSECWRQEDSRGAPPPRPTRIGSSGAHSWQRLDVGGDCRYWPVAAWVQFLLGWREVAANPVLLAEYEHRLDFHALGLTAVQVVAETLPLPLEAPDGAAGPASDTPEEFWALQRAWIRYWNRVLALHCELVEVFTSKGDWDVVKAQYIQDGLHERIADDMSEIRKALSAAADACARAPASAKLGDAPALFHALLFLVGDGYEGPNVGSGPGAESSGPQRWREVQAVLAGPPPRTRVPKGARAGGLVPHCEEPQLNAEPGQDLMNTISKLSDKVERLSSVMAKLEGRRETPAALRPHGSS